MCVPRISNLILPNCLCTDDINCVEKLENGLIQQIHTCIALNMYETTEANINRELESN